MGNFKKTTLGLFWGRKNFSCELESSEEDLYIRNNYFKLRNKFFRIAIGFSKNPN